MIQPFISVVIPLYNKEKYITRCLNSVLSQTYSNFEVIIVDDGSTDSSLQIAQTISDSRIKVCHKSHSGVSSARNWGIKMARGEIVAFLDADDCWLQEFLSEIVTLVNMFPTAEVYATAPYQNNGKRVSDSLIDMTYKRGWKGIIPIIDLFFRCIPFNSSSVAIQKSTFEKANLFDEDMKIGEDINMWMRLSLLVPIAYSCTYLSEVFKDAQNRSNYEESSMTGTYIINKSINDVKSLNTNLSEFTKTAINQIEKRLLDYSNIETFISIGKSHPKSIRGKLLILELEKSGFINSLLTTPILSFQEKFIFSLRSIYWITISTIYGIK